MRTKVSPIYDKVIEAGWLLALVIVPLFFNVYSSRVFEPDKLGLLRSIASLMLVVWLAKVIDGRSLRAKRQVSSSDGGAGWELSRFLRTPLVVPTLLLALVYVFATVTSLVPRISLWGSYQRLQGTYTTLSYMVVFMLLLQTLRRREQLQRLVTALILTSLAPSLYGLVQHYGLDPLPWGGDVTFRVASNMGNAIFIGAFLILVVPLTLARILQLLAHRDTAGHGGPGTGFIILYGLLFILQFWVWSSLGFGRGLAVSLLCIVALVLVPLYQRRPVPRYLLLAVYASVLAVQLLCLLFSQSRGPMLGIAGGFFFFGLLYTFVRRWSWATVGLVTLAVVFIVVLLLINLPRSPLAFVRDVPYVGRLGRVFEIEGGTGKVRVLIWEGVVEMLGANPARTFIGYGPEAMYVAYNPYYPPELAHYEARNASPDRSHNETFDALVTTGILGLLVYMFLFSSVFYYGMHALGLLRADWQKRLYWICALGGAVLGVLVPLAADHSLRFAGVGLPVGYMAGLSAFLAVSALTGMWRKERSSEANAQVSGRVVLLVGLIAGIVAHFVEIHFGIAVAATRSYFWAYVALLVLVGQKTVPVGISPKECLDQEEPAKAAKRSGKRKRPRRRAKQVDPWAAPASQLAETATGQLLAFAVIVGIILVTLAWDYTTNPLASDKAGEILAKSLATMAARRQPNQASYGLLWLIFGTGLIASLACLGEVALTLLKPPSARWWLLSGARVLGPALLIGLLYGFIHAARLAPGVEIADLIYEFAVAMLILWAILAVALGIAGGSRGKTSLGIGLAVGIALSVACLFFADAVNLRPIKADTLYKQGLKFDQESAWDNAIYFYQQALDVAPREDFYYLFNGRAYMEKAKQETNRQMQQAYFEEALRSLLRARELNPLNTDHTANMARLYRTWGEKEPDAQVRQERLYTALRGYEEATVLSPHNAQLFNEWGLVYFMLGDMPSAKAKYSQSLALDDEFIQTYLLIGDIYWTQKDWPNVINTYEKTVALNPKFVQGWSALGYAHSQVGELEQAIEANSRVLEFLPADYGTLKNIAILYNQLGRSSDALIHAKRALAVAPDKDKPVLESFVQQLSSGN